MEETPPLKLDLYPKPEPEHICEGVFFRGYNNVFFSGGRLEQKRGFRLLKRKSCSGCENCHWLRDEAIAEEVSYLTDLGEIKDYGLYQLCVITTGGGGWDGDYDYDYELKFNLVKEKKSDKQEQHRV